MATKPLSTPKNKVTRVFLDKTFAKRVLCDNAERHMDVREEMEGRGVTSEAWLACATLGKVKSNRGLKTESLILSTQR